MLNDELELLQNIYIDELIIARDVCSPTPASVTIQVHPATCDRADEQYVCVTATFRLPPEYPAVPPIFDLSSPRGLADEELDLLRARVGSLLAASVGAPMLHEAIELVREVLTDSNVPHGQCSICLSGFDGQTSIAKTDCYHYFHACCLAQYVLHKSKELSDGSLSELPSPGSSAASTQTTGLGGATEVYPCPVCRKATIHGGDGGGPSTTAAAGLLAAGYDDDTQPSLYEPTSEVLRQREDMRRLYERQQRNGGIIDIEAERARLQLPPPLPPQASSNMMELVSDSLAVVSSQTEAAVVLSCAAAGAAAGSVKVSSLGNSSAAPPAGPAATAAAPAARAGFPETHTVSGSQWSHRQQQQRRQHLACAKSCGGSTRHPPRDKRPRPDAAAAAAATAERGNEPARLPGASSAGRPGGSAATAAAAVHRCDDGGESGGCSGRP